MKIKRKPDDLLQEQQGTGVPQIGVQHETLQQVPNTAERRFEQEASVDRESPQAEVVDGFSVLSEIIGKEEIQKALVTLQKYKTGKANLEKRVIENAQWYKLRHWECMRKSETSPVEPVSGWLFNALANKHADAMDNFPSPNILPREKDDREMAMVLSAILPVILEQNEFEAVYSKVWDCKLVAGTGIYGVFWDKDKLNGLGDISIQKVDIINLFWESGITDIQRSRNVFHVELQDDDMLLSTYPQLEGKLGGSTMNLSEYVYDDSVDTTGKSAVVDWYYKKKQNGKVVLHYCKFVNDVVLFATENDTEAVLDDKGNVIRPAMAETGWYDHGMYPFVFDPLFTMEGSPCGFGYIDVGKSAQEYIDRGNQAIMQNMLANAKPRYFIRGDGSVNETEFADLSKDFVHVDGNLGQDSILPVQGKPLNSIYVQIVDRKIDELKEVTGNRDISNGGTSSGVTAASAIAAMQEAGSKLSRDGNKASYRAFRKMCLMIIELVRQFYVLPRCFRIVGEGGAHEYIQFSNNGLRPQHQGVQMGVDMGYRLPIFDITVSAQKQSAYSKLSQNELAIQFFNAGFFDPMRAQQALACLEIMDFDRKQFVIDTINEGQTLMGMLQQSQQRCMQLAKMVDMLTKKTNLAGALAEENGMPAGGDSMVQMSDEGAIALGADALEPENTKKARQRVAESTNPT